MKRELGIARCGLACCLCSENATCAGCDSGECPDKDRDGINGDYDDFGDMEALIEYIRTGWN